MVFTTNKISNFFYSKHTNYKLNYLTLSIKDKEISKKVQIHRANQFKSLL